MQFKEYVKKTCRESSIHGLAYLVRYELHWAERLFWLGAIISATYFSINVCLNQWERFRDNPIVYAMELTWGKRDFPYAGITLCSDFQNEDDLAVIIKSLWDVTPNDTKYEYYREFLYTLNTLRFDTLDTLAPYEHDATLHNINLVETLLAMKKSILPSRIETSATSSGSPIYSNDLENPNLIYAAAITEAGLCRTTSQLTEYTNPYGELKSLVVTPILHCGFMHDCNTKIFPGVPATTKLFIYIHNALDIVAPNDRSTILREGNQAGSLTIELMLDWTTAEAEVRNLPIAYRKCRYIDENNLEFFELYRPGLCRIECRIKTALDLCQCKPYFYAVAPKTPICDVDGMICLARKAWSDTRCNCVPLCEEISYTGLQSSEILDESAKFERTIIVRLSLPRMALKRRVVFSTDQLVVSFGGAIGLFLGASFISVFGLIHLLGEYVLGNCKAWWNKCRQRRRIAEVRIVRAI